MNRILFLLAFSVSLQVSGQDHSTLLSATNLENITYPFPVSYIHLTIQGEPLQMAFMDVKPVKPNGQTVMLLHGKNFCAAYWGRTAKDLRDKGYRVIMPDQIGFGKSSKPYRVQYTFQLLAENTKAILDSLGVGKIALLGHSMGGMVAVRFALMYPETVDKLILENPIGLEDWKLKVPYQSVDDWYADELKQHYASLKKYQATFYYDNQWKPEYDEWLNIQAGWTNNIDYPHLAWNAALTYDMIFTQPVCYEFGNLTMPTLLIIGQRDRTALGKGKAPENVQETLGNYPVLGKETAKKIKGSKLVELPGIGHLPHIEAYNQFINPLTDFLSQ